MEFCRVFSPFDIRSFQSSSDDSRQLSVRLLSHIYFATVRSLTLSDAVGHLSDRSERWH